MSTVVKAQNDARPSEISEEDGIAVLIKHLPEWETVHANSTFAKDSATLKNFIGDKPVLDLIDFSVGTEAVTANYGAGRLLIVEFMTPQGSIDADTKINQHLAANPDAGTIYRRIGNYNTFVFNATDAAAANALLDQIKYQKTVQWLGSDPYLNHRAERHFVEYTSDLFVSTVMAIVLGIGLSILVGIGVGLVYFRHRANQRFETQSFSDGGGLTRLDLDGDSYDMRAKPQLNE